jgi:hypothetical protein
VNLGLFKYAALKSADLTPAIVVDIAKMLGMEIAMDAHLFNQVVKLLAENDVDGLADLVGTPEVLQKLRALLGSSTVAQDDNLIICPHCRGFINMSEGV